MRKVHGNDSFQRMNFLYQISKQIAPKYPVLSAYYGNLVINVAKKMVLKIHPDMKRQICKKCRCILIDGETAKIKIKRKNKSKYIVWTCDICGMKKSYPADENKDHRVWSEKPESVVEVIH
ncbi:ribonuclease P protein subunit p21 [Danaus plexippus plexippus]|uniref:Ribonuclease P protein subunit p21 n=1 Tax=Danaus plexippus plexippus TaxID=278856 RepID=A0A212FPX2_DANPL|nr:ribonuclease P protein subunit rpr2 [Danaus plexippus plexippus]OWR55808.1 ribonuclease P protein subunit p21 [Danaus plexippus plexippus]